MAYPASINNLTTAHSSGQTITSADINAIAADVDGVTTYLGIQPATGLQRQHLAPIGMVGQGDINVTRDTALLASQYAAGVRMWVMEPRWGVAQTSALATLDATTMTAYQQRIDDFVALGPDSVIALDLGLQYCGAWVENQDPITDQYNVQWKNIRGGGSPCANIAWSSTVRTWTADYIQKLFAGLNFHGRLWAVRTGQYIAEWAFPPHTNSSVVGNTTALSGSGTVMTYTVANALVAGNHVTVTGAVPSGYNGANLLVATASGTQFTVAGATTGAQTTLGAVTVANPGSLWAYDTTAQTYFAAQSVGGVAPPRRTKAGLVTFGSGAQAAFFYGMYVDALTGAANFIHDTVRQYTSAWICPLTPGGGLWQSLMNTYTANLLDETVNASAPLSAGNWWERMNGSIPVASPATPQIPSFRSRLAGCMNWVSSISSDGNTGLTDYENSLFPWDWTSTHQAAYLAAANGRFIYGENSGNLADSSPAGLIVDFNLARQWGLQGLMWVRQTQMLTGGYATLANLATAIANDKALP